MKTITNICLLILLLILTSCEKFIDIKPPAHILNTAKVFDNDEAANSALQGIYNELFYSSAFSNGGNGSCTALAGLSADELEPIDGTNNNYLEFQEKQILPSNTANLGIWSSAYRIIYQTNALLEGVKQSNSITTALRNRLEGEAKFIRAFTYFYLVNLYNNPPLILSTNYKNNALAQNTLAEDIYKQVILDLSDALDLLDVNYYKTERVYANKYAAEALLARVYLYNKQWEKAEQHSTNVINQTALYQLPDNLDQVFLANSHEAIWQISPAGAGDGFTNTKEGYLFISSFPVFKLANGILNSFSNIDKRKSHWIGVNQDNNAAYPFKYKIGSSTASTITEYSMVLRLAEQYFIRAEAQAQLGNIPAAIAAIDHIRERAGIPLIAQSQPQISKEDFLTLLLEERERELFSEWGHRWLDLKRTNKATEVLQPANTLWQETDVFYPIPEEERIKNPNLTQNPGY